MGACESSGREVYRETDAFHIAPDSRLHLTDTHNNMKPSKDFCVDLIFVNDNGEDTGADYEYDYDYEDSDEEGWAVWTPAEVMTPPNPKETQSISFKTVDTSLDFKRTPFIQRVNDFCSVKYLT